MFEEVLLSTYAKDGGLWVPVSLPQLSAATLLSWKDMIFSEVCAEVLHLYTDIEISILKEMTKDAFSIFNDGLDPLPIQKYDNIILLDCSLGPTLAFKDVGLSVIGKLLNYVLGSQNKKANIVVDTSGDTGPAAIMGVRGCPNVDIFCLYPHGRVSRVQELQMITVLDENVHVYRTEGTSDQQASVLKELFTDLEFVKSNNICSVNSINWARIAVQCSYYIWAYLQINKDEQFGLPVHFCIPTGAFGNACAGLIAKKMGVPIGRIICATNMNDIVHRTISQGDMSMGSNIQTVSPAMDIQFAYNLERMLYYISNENCNEVKEIMLSVDQQFSYVPGATGAKVKQHIVDKMQEVFYTISVNNEDTLATMKKFKEDHDFLLCPHSAISVFAALTKFALLAAEEPLVCVLTAHPAKFEDAVRKAIGEDPPYPPSVTEMSSMPHTFKWLRKRCNKEGVDVDENSWRAEWIAILKADIER